MSMCRGYDNRVDQQPQSAKLKEFRGHVARSAGSQVGRAIICGVLGSILAHSVHIIRLTRYSPPITRYSPSPFMMLFGSN